MIETTILSATGSSTPVKLDVNRSPLVGLLVNVPGGVTLTGGVVEVSGLAAGPWNPHDTLVALTASANGNLSFPIGYVRLTGTISGGSATLQVIQPDKSLFAG